MRAERWYPQLASSTRQSLAWTIGIMGGFLIILILFIGIQTIRAAYAFYNIARSTTQGTVEGSQVTGVYCSYYIGGACQNYVTSCSATVGFTPLGQITSFSTTDNQCDLAKGTKVEVLYDPNDPRVAKTSRQASADVEQAIDATIGFLFGTIILLLWVICKIQGD